MIFFIQEYLITICPTTIDNVWISSFTSLEALHYFSLSSQLQMVFRNTWMNRFKFVLFCENLTLIICAMSMNLYSISKINQNDLFQQKLSEKAYNNIFKFKASKMTSNTSCENIVYQHFRRECWLWLLWPSEFSILWLWLYWSITCPSPFWKIRVNTLLIIYIYMNPH